MGLIKLVRFLEEEGIKGKSFLCLILCTHEDQKKMAFFFVLLLVLLIVINGKFEFFVKKFLGILVLCEVCF